MSCVIQVSKDAVLSLENASILTDGLLVVRVEIERIRPCKVPDLCYAQFTVAYLLIQKAGFNLMRMNISISSYDIMVDTAPIVECFALNWTSCVE